MLFYFLAVVLATIPVSTPINPVQPVTIEGIVLNAETGKPLSDAHVFIIKGEEEAVTNSSGTFRIVSWQRFPITLTVQHPSREEKKIKLTAPPKQLQILLKSK